MMDSPALSVASDFSDMSDEELDKYFASYVPLSNLPTPPPAKEQPIPSPPTSRSDSNAETEVQQHQTPELEAYATHLVNLVPRNVSTQKPSVPIICGFLERACLPDEIVAFAACVLDALSQRFASCWRDALLPPNQERIFNFYLGTNTWRNPTTSPEVIVLSALALAHGFIDDRGRLNSHWAKVAAKSQFSVREIEVTKTCILQDMDYGLFRISDGMVGRMMRDMRRAAPNSKSVPTISLERKDSVAAEREERRPKLALSTGTPGGAVWAFGVHTPEPSP